MCARRRTFFWRNPLRGLSCAAKVRCAHGALVLKHSSPKRRQKKATPLSASPALRTGATCGARVQRGLAQTRCAQTVASPDPLAATLLGAYTGAGQPTSTRAIASLGPACAAPSACAREVGSSAATTRVAVRLLGCPPPVAAPAAGRLRGGMGVEAPMLRHLTRRGCPNGALQRAVSFAAHPATAPTQVCPFAPRRGRRLGVALSLVTFFGPATRWRRERK